MGVKIDLIDGRNNYLAYSDSYALHSIDCFGHVLCIESISYHWLFYLKKKYVLQLHV